MKTKINISNYEAYWLDYLNEQLSEEMESQLFYFLEKNPDLYDNLIDDDELKLKAPEISFQGKEKLYAENQTDNLLIAKLENSISEENDKFITEKIKTDKKIGRDFELYKKTKLVADKNIVFPDKNKLKKSISIPLYQRITAIAAIFLVVYVAGTYIFKQAEDLKIENVRFSELEISVKSAEKKTTEEIALISESSYTVEKKTTTETITESKQEKIIYSERGYEIEAIEKMSIKQASPIALNFDINYNLLKEKEVEVEAEENHTTEQSLNFTVEYIEAEQENRLISSINKIFDVGREINITESIQNLRDKRNEILLSSINN